MEEGGIMGLGGVFYVWGMKILLLWIVCVSCSF